MPLEPTQVELRDQLAALRERRRRLRDDLAEAEGSAGRAVEALAHLRDEVARELAPHSLAGGNQDDDLRQDLDAATHEVTDFVEHLTARSHALDGDFDQLQSEAHALEAEVQQRHGVEREEVGRVGARAAEFHQAIEGHRSSLTAASGSAAQSLADTEHHTTARHQGLDHQLARLHESAAQAGHDTADATREMAAHGHSAADDLREHLGLAGALIAAATERIQRSVESTIEHEIHGLIHEVVQALQQMFDDLVSRLGHSHAELEAARELIEPIIRDLEGLIPGLQSGVHDANDHVAEVERQRALLEAGDGIH